MPLEKQYLGDGVYAGVEHGMIKLTTTISATRAPPQIRMSRRSRPSLKASRIAATARIQATEPGMRTFQPSFMNWS